MPEHAGDLRAVEAAGKLVEPAAAALRVERAEFVQFVEPEGHHVRECPLVDVADDVLEIGAVPGAAIHGWHDVFDRDEVAMVAAEADDVVLVAGPRERRQFRSLMPTLDRQPAALRTCVHDQLAGAGQLRVEHPAAKQPLEAEEHRPQEFEQGCLARFVGAVEHLYAGAELVDRDTGQRAGAFDVDCFDVHVADSVESFSTAS